MWFVVKATPLTPVGEEDRKLSENGRLGRCRRHAPTMNGYPACFEADWCGDHKMDESRL